MRGFLLGLLTAAVLGGGALSLLRPQLLALLQDPCEACGPGTRCEARRCLPEPAAPVAAAPPRKRGRPGRGVQRAGAEEPQEPPQMVLKPAELRPQTVGDNLGKTEVIDLAQGADRGEGRELTDDAIDGVFRPAQAAVIACLDEARGDAVLSGRMTLSFRVQRSGAVSGVRLEAPAYLITRGLYGCVRPVVAGLRFPASSRGQVVTYPFTLR